MKKLVVAAILMVVSILGHATPVSDTQCPVGTPACAGVLTLSNCPTNYVWKTTGSSVAHCAKADYNCGWGYTLQHDSLGNAYCTQNTCPSNQQLQADGVSCACASGYVWNGASCVIYVPPPPPLTITPVTSTGSTTINYSPMGTMLYCPYTGNFAHYYASNGTSDVTNDGVPSGTGYPTITVYYHLPASPSGGTPPYSYSWTITGGTGGTVGIDNPNSQTGIFHLYAGFMYRKSTTATHYVRVTVRDSAGQSTSIDWTLVTTVPGSYCL